MCRHCFILKRWENITKFFKKLLFLKFTSSIYQVRERVKTNKYIYRTKIVCMNKSKYYYASFFQLISCTSTTIIYNLLHSSVEAVWYWIGVSERNGMWKGVLTDLEGCVYVFSSLMCSCSMPGTSYSRPYICKYNNRFLLFSRLACRSTTIYIILSIPRLHFELHRFLEILGMYFSFSSLFKNVLFFLYSTPLNKGSFSSSSGGLEACYPSGKLKYIYSHNSSKLHPLYHTYSAYFLTPGTFGLRSPLVLTIC